MDNVKKPNRLISFIENTDIPLAYYLLTFAGVLLIETFLEIFSDTAVISFKFSGSFHQMGMFTSLGIAISIAHIFLWWVAVFFSIPILLSVITQERIEKTIRATLAFSWLAILTPVTDLIISGGKGIDMHYLQHPKDILHIFNPQLGLTPGENLAFAIVLVLIFLYCVHKTRNIGKAILGAVFFGLISFLASTFPFYMNRTAAFFHINLLSITPIPIIRILVITILAEAIIMLFLWNRKVFSAAFKKTGILRPLHFILLFLLGMVLFNPRCGKLILENFGCFILSLISIFLVWGASTILGFLANPDSAGSAGALRKIAWWALFFAGFSAATVNFTTFYFVALGSVSAVIYFYYPFRLKRVPLASKIPIAFGMLLCLMLGWLFCGGEILDFPKTLLLYFLVFITACLNFLDLKNASEDKAGGKRRAGFIIGVIFLLTYLMLPGVLLTKVIFLPTLVLGITQFIAINRKNYQEKQVLVVSLLTLSYLVIWLGWFNS